jgi:hypothetical protein
MRLARHRQMRRIVSFLAVFLGVPVTAHAFTTASSQTDPCHERFTVDAVRAAGWPGGAAPPALDDHGAALVDDGLYALPDDVRDVWTFALVEGVRHNDVGGHDLDELVEIAVDAARAEEQREHCLRAPLHDGEAGDPAALAACQAFILEQIGAALGDGDDVDLGATETATITLVFRGSTDVALQRYALRAGMALHALQDAFSHTFRVEAGTRVTHVLNYADFVEKEYVEPRDGHAHMSSLDRCTDDLEPQRVRTGNATAASTELLRALADPAGGRQGRMDRAAAVVDRWLQYRPGCTFDNAYCNASELREPSVGGCGCTLAPSSTPGLGLLAVVLATGLCRSRRVRVAVVAACGALWPARAAADEVDEPPSEDGADEPGDPVNRGVGFYVGGAGSLDQASAALSAGIRVDVVHWLSLGVDAEYNPWLSIEGARAAAGTTNVYAPLVFTWAALGPAELRSTLMGGISILNCDLLGAEQGSVGPFVGTTPLGVAIRASRVLRVVIDPGGLVLAVPQTSGIPLIYREHRFALGLQVTP